MDNNNELQEFDLDDILNEFHESEEAAAENSDLSDSQRMPALTTPSASREEEAELEAFLTEFSSGNMEQDPKKTDPALDGDTVMFIPLSEVQETVSEEQPEPAKDPALEGDTIHLPQVEAEAAKQAPVAEPAFEVEEEFIPEPILFMPRSRIRELKKKLVEGPEKRYYELAEIGVGKLQIAILLNILIVVLCAGVTTLFALDMIPDDRLRLVIFSQVLAMMVSALLGSHLMVDSVADLLKGRFTVNTLLTLTFAACMLDGVMCLMELRVPCCAAFSLEMTMAMWARMQQRNTEMAQMDTLRKAVRLHGIVRVEDYFEGRDGLLRTEGEVEDFMDNYSRPSAPQMFQSVYAVLSLLACVAIAVFAGMLHGVSMAVQILSTSLLVAVPATFFVSITRPAAILQQRLHMVGTVLCGWQGVKDLCGKLAVPLKDSDLFPQGSTKLNGVKFYGDRNPDEVVSYSTSLISKTGSGLVPVFKQLLASRNGVEHNVHNFHNYGDGGIGGEICGEPVLLGTLNFLQDMGVEIPDGTMVNQAVYAAIDGQLCAVYAISYAKMRSASAGLVTLCGCRDLIPVMLCGDFMITESFLEGKFNVKTKRIAFPAREERIALSKIRPDPEEAVLALTTREELVSAAYAVSGARALRVSTKLGVTIHLVGGILGMLIMLVLAYLGSTELLTPVNILLYQLIWAIPGLLVTEWVRTV